MASSATSNEFEQSLKILTVLAESKRESVVAICHKTGLKLVDIFRCADTLENAGIIAREKLNGNTFVILKNHNYQAKLEQIFGVSVPKQNTTPTVHSANQVSVDRREAILKRRQERVAKANQENEVSKIEKKKPTPISAVDLLAIKRSGGINKKIHPNPRSGKLSAPIGFVKKSDQENDLRNTGRKPAVSSNAYKSVNMSRSSNKLSSFSRSTYMSSAINDSLNERTDTNFKQLENIERPSQGPIIPFKNTVRASNEIHEIEVREKIGLRNDQILISFLMPKPNNEFWKACSAVANSGGGAIVLGMKKYGTDGDASFFIKSITRPEETKKNLILAFNDRKYISDCPRDKDFIKIVEFKKSKVLVVNLNPEDMSPAPLFIDKDSFSTSECAGCFVYKNGNIEHCSEEEVKNLWYLKRLENLELDEEIDWDQSDELLQIDMNRKKLPDVPTGFNESIMPLSQSECVYGKKLPSLIPPSLTKKYPGMLPPERTPVNFSAVIHTLQCADPKSDEERRFLEEQIHIVSEMAIAEKVAKAEADSKKNEKKDETKVVKPYPEQPKMIGVGGKLGKINAANASALRVANAAFQNISTISKPKTAKSKPEHSDENKRIINLNTDESRRMINDEIKRIETRLAEAKASARSKNLGKEAEKVDIKAQREAAARAELEDELNVLRASSTKNPKIGSRNPISSDTDIHNIDPSIQAHNNINYMINLKDLTNLDALKPVDEAVVQELLMKAAAYYGSKLDDGIAAAVDSNQLSIAENDKIKAPAKLNVSKDENIDAVPSDEAAITKHVVKTKPDASDIKNAENVQIAENVQTTQASVKRHLDDASELPPKLADADRSHLDEIALPVVEHPRLPQARVCEITVELLKLARLKPTEIAEILHKKLVPVRDKIIPKIRETHQIIVVDGFYYIKK